MALSSLSRWLIDLSGTTQRAGTKSSLRTRTRWPQDPMLRSSLPSSRLLDRSKTSNWVCSTPPITSLPRPLYPSSRTRHSRTPLAPTQMDATRRLSTMAADGCVRNVTRNGQSLSTGKSSRERQSRPTADCVQIHPAGQLARLGGRYLDHGVQRGG